MAYLDCDSCVVKTQGGEKIANKEKQSAPNRSPSLADSRSKLFVIIDGALLVIYNLLIYLLRLKYRGMKETPFETHSLLIHTSITAFLVASLTSMVLFYDYLQRLNRKPFFSVIYMIAKIVFYFTIFIAHLSILLLLTIG